MVVFETDIGNFGSPRDMLQHMEEEGVEAVHVTTKLCGEIVGEKNFEMTIQDVEKWVEMGKEGWHDFFKESNENIGTY